MQQIRHLLVFPVIPWAEGFFLIFVLLYAAWYDYIRRVVPAWLVLPAWLLGCLLWILRGYWIVLVYVVVFVLEEFFFPWLLGGLMALAATGVAVLDPRMGFLLVMWTALILLFHYLNAGGVPRGIGGGDIWMLMLLFTFFPYLSFVIVLVVVLFTVGVPELVKKTRMQGGALLEEIRRGFCNPPPLDERGRSLSWVYSLAGIVYVFACWVVNGMVNGGLI